ncbi:hypothetical protein OESDEN_20299 [Oesophagostomum dentatum]|uniref:Uncharacterized protein n=1 Tax=Oesophagostomum dentatum TaxID=61180 RepID=A0A0B1S812_OESDE|nr:hypothetical protein OESDEN_20299 [Oesophagostomum dentatum]
MLLHFAYDWNSTAFILSVIGCYACTFLLIQIIAIAILHKIEKRQSMNNLKEMVRNQRI